MTIQDEHTSEPDPNKRLRLRRAMRGECCRCGSKTLEPGYSTCRQCLQKLKAKKLLVKP